MNGAHLHLLINHVPVLGTVFGLGLLGFALWRRSDEVTKAAFGTLFLIALSALAANLTGEPAEDVVKGLAGIPGGAIGQHEEAAEVALWGSIIVGAASLGGLVWFRGNRPVKTWASIVVLVGALVVSGLMAWTAFLGGKIRHAEFQTKQVTQAVR